VLLGGYLGARLQAKEHYAFSLTEAAPPLGITICVLATPGGSSLLPLVWGTLGGYLLYVTWLAVMTMRVDPPLGRPKLHRTPELWRPLYVSFLTMGLAQVLITLTLPIDQAFAAQLGEGAIATLGYANRIVMLVTGLGAVVLGRALLPILSEAAASSAERSLGERQATRWAILMFVVGLVILGMGWVLAPTAVRILFERGAFEASDTIVVSGLLRVGLVQVPMFLAGMVLVQWYAAADRYRAILAITSAALIAKIVSNVMLVETLGLEGIMLGTAVMYSVTMLAMAIGVRRPGAEVRVR
jgi:peptidoglycan biosynthesis protein MviN/MurJ (putative lipid II flippase)